MIKEERLLSFFLDLDTSVIATIDKNPLILVP
jgi:hypothetical protein